MPLQRHALPQSEPRAHRHLLGALSSFEALKSWGFYPHPSPREAGNIVPSTVERSACAAARMLPSCGAIDMKTSHTPAPYSIANFNSALRSASLSAVINCISGSVISSLVRYAMAASLFVGRPKQSLAILAGLKLIIVDPSPMIGFAVLGINVEVTPSVAIG